MFGWICCVVVMTVLVGGGGTCCTSTSHGSKVVFVFATFVHGAGGIGCE